MAEERRSVLRRYWDSTCFLALLNDEEDAARCEQILEEAKRLSTEIYVLPLVQVEVVRPRGVPRPLAATQRERIRAFFENEYVKGGSSTARSQMMHRGCAGSTRRIQGMQSIWRQQST